MSSTIHVSNIAPQTTEQQVRDFFSFCGLVKRISLSSDESSGTQKATVTFDQPGSADTAALLNGTVLDSGCLSITKASAESEEASKSSLAYESAGVIPQEDKPLRRVVAELLAHGYAINQTGIELALKLDREHGVSARWKSWLDDMEKKFQTQKHAQEFDAKYKISDNFAKLCSTWSSYFDTIMASASQTPTGLKLREFYTDTMHTVQGVHEEAKHIKNTMMREGCGCTSAATCTCAPGKCACPSTAPCQVDKARKAGQSCCQSKADSTCACSSETCHCDKPKGSSGNCGCSTAAAKCPCPEKTCKCSGCPKNQGVKDCGCGGESEKCVCAAGSCKCASCPKNASS